MHHTYKKPLLGLILLLLLGGGLAYTHLKTGLFPDITFPKIKVIADAGQQPIGKMMALVTVPLENALKRVEGLDYLRSATSRGSCEISVFLEWNTDVDRAKLQIESIINQSQQNILAGTHVEVQKMNPSILPVMAFSFEGNRSQMELRKIAQLQIKPFLAATPGVSDIAIIGGKTKEYQVIVNPQKLSELRISLQTIANTVAESNILRSNGYINDYDRLYLTLTDNSLDNKEELENLVIMNSPKRVVLLKDIAEVVITEKKEYIKIKANGKDVPLVAVIKQPNANLIDVTNGINERVRELEKILPGDVKLKPYYEQADFVNESIHSLRDVLWIGILLAVFVVIIFLRSMKSSIVVLFTIPLTVALTLIVLYAMNYTFNIMTLGAIAAAVGLMIDDAVIVVEQIHRSHEENPGEEISSVVSKAIHYLFPAMVGSSLSTIVIFIPFLWMSGIAGAYFKVLAITMIVALSSSFFTTWLFIPVLFLLIGVSQKVKHVYHARTGWVRFFIRRPAISFLFVSGLIAALVIIPRILPSGFLPEMDEGGIVLDYLSPPGTKLEETNQLLSKVDAIVQSQPEVANFSRRTGTEMGFFITEPNRGDYLIQLKKKRDKTTDEVSDEIRTKIEAAIPQLHVDFGQVIGDMLGDLISSVQPIEIKVFGDNEKKIKDISRQVASEVSNIKGTADVFDGIIIAGPEVNVQPQVAKLAQFGITPADFQFQLQTQLEGNVIGSILEKEQAFDIRLIYPKAKNTTINTLRNSNLFLPDGKLRPLSTVADITIESGVAEITRENQKMMGVVTARLDQRDLGSTLGEIQNKLSSMIHLPSGYHIEYGGAYKEQQNAFRELLTIFIAAAMLVFIVMLVLFREFKISFLTISLALLGAAGCLLALLVTGTPLNVGSYCGIIMIIGIIGENAIFTYRQFKLALKTMATEDAILFSIGTRLRPKLMTAIGAITALFPLALGMGVGAQLHQPLAIAVIGGLIIALPLLLIVYPAMIRLLYLKARN